MVMWLRHWKLDRDPFSNASPRFVPTSGHAEAVARLVHAIESGWPTASLRAGAGLGKSRVLAEALTEVRGPTLRIARSNGPMDGPALLADLAAGLGMTVPVEASRALAWRRLTEAIRLCQWQGLRVILAIDDAHHLVDPADRLDLQRLAHLDPRFENAATVLVVGREPEMDFDSDQAWDFAIRLAPLTRTEAGDYLIAKLAAAGGEESAFSPKAITRLHALARGVPAGLDRLAMLALMVGAVLGREIVTPEIVEEAARECDAA